MSDRDKQRELDQALRPAVITPRMELWMRETGLTDLGARAILDYAIEELRKAMQDQAHPIMVFQSFIAACEAAFEGANMPEAERLEFLVTHYRLIAPVVREQINSFKPKRDGALIQTH